MRLFVTQVKKKLLCSRSSRSSSRSFFFFHFFFGFLSFFGFFSRFFLFFFHVSSRSSRLSSRLGSVSSENNGRERQCYEGGNDCGQNFFHLYYLQINWLRCLLYSRHRAKQKLNCN